MHEYRLQSDILIPWDFLIFLRSVTLKYLSLPMSGLYIPVQAKHQIVVVLLMPKRHLVSASLVLKLAHMLMLSCGPCSYLAG